MSKKNKYLALATMILCILLLAVKATGPVIHVLCGMLLTVISGKHLWRRIRLFPHMRKQIQVVDLFVIVSFVVMLGSGMLLHLWEGILVVRMLHKLSGVCFVIFVIAHGIQHVGAKKIRKQ